MVLHPLEFSECYLDSPWFRQSIQQYEEELERTNVQIKQLIKDGKIMLNAFRGQGKAVSVFNERLRNFQFDCIGENLTDDEKGIAGSLKEFGSMLEEIAEQWSDTVDRCELQLIKPLEVFRKQNIHGYKENKKLFDKASERYYKQLEHTLGLSHKKKELQLQESDNELMYLKRQFHKEALNYVYKLQEVQERKKFEFVEHLLMFMKVYFNFFKQSHETAVDCREYITDLQVRLVTTRDQYEGTRDKTQNLMKKMEEQPDAWNNPGQLSDGRRWSRAGYLFMSDKNTISARLTSKWTRYFCTYNKDNKLIQIMSAFNSSSGVAATFNQTSTQGSGSYFEPMIVRSCTRRSTDSIDKRFCFDLEVEDTAGKSHLLTFQAISDADRKEWMLVMDGKEPQYIQAKDFLKKESKFKLDEIGFTFIECVIAEIERRGVDHEGIYRLVGVMSKVDLLIKQALDLAQCGTIDYRNEIEWEINTLTSALKSALRNMPDPLMTFELHRDFIDAAKCESHQERVVEIAALVDRLPAQNKKMLSMLMMHLRKVEASHAVNKMTIQNLGVCFGPTLMREKQETVQSIMELKFTNIIVEILIEEYESLFDVSEKDDAEKNLNKKSPTVAPKPKPMVTRLPSQRFRTRPRAMYEPTSVPNILESNDEKDDGLGRNQSALFRRGKAFRSPDRRSRSPKSRLNKLAIVQRDSYSSTDDDELGHISPIDLNLGFDHITKPSVPEKTYVNVVQKESDVQGASRVSKEYWNPNGALGAGDASLASPESDGATNNSPDSVTSEPSLAVAAKPISKPDVSPAPKKRFSSRRTLKKKTSGNEPVYAQVNKNQNSNAKAPQKPRSLAVRAAIAQKSFKFLNSVKESGLQSPTASVKYAKRMLTSPAKLKPKSPSPTSTVPEAVRAGRSPNVKRRPKSEFIPAAFMVEEDAEATATVILPLEKKTSPAGDVSNGAGSANDVGVGLPQVRPRSSAVLSREYQADKDADSDISEYSSDEIVVSDDVTITNVARTLYACCAEHDSELSFQPGELIRSVERSDEPGWLRGILNGRIGLFPQNYVKFV